MSRTFTSRPVTLALEDGLLSAGTSFFDYGCGRGDDVRRLKELGFEASGWDPAFAVDVARRPADVVNLGYVVNVIESPRERVATLRDAWRLTQRTLIVAARPDWEGRSLAGARRHGDGVLTSTGTFQRFFRQDELRAWIDATLGVRAVAAAPGIFYVFRDREYFQTYLARQSRHSTRHAGIRVADILFERHREALELLKDHVYKARRLPKVGEFSAEAQLVGAFGSLRSAFAIIRKVTGSDQWNDVDVGSRTRQSEKRYQRNRELLDPLIAFVEQRGRLPQDEELPNADLLAAEFGSVRSAFALIRRATGAEQWERVRDRSRENFLVYLALAAFEGRSRLRELPPDLQYDVRELFGTYKEACKRADELLFSAGNREAIDSACRNAPVGKLTPEALYAHKTSIALLPPVLRVYEGCGRALTGTVDSATIVKLHRIKSQISYLEYPDFDDDPHPALATVVIARLPRLDVGFKDFRKSENPPILHRKETFVSEDYPGRSKFQKLTLQEERRGLLNDAADIGTLNGWRCRMDALGVRLRGHQVVSARP